MSKKAKTYKISGIVSSQGKHITILIANVTYFTHIVSHRWAHMLSHLHDDLPILPPKHQFTFKNDKGGPGISHEACL